MTAPVGGLEGKHDAYLVCHWNNAAGRQFPGKRHYRAATESWQGIYIETPTDISPWVNVLLDRNKRDPPLSAVGPITLKRNFLVRTAQYWAKLLSLLDEYRLNVAGYNKDALD